MTSNADNLEKWKPIGTDDTGKRFTGIFDGNNKTISGLYYNNSETSYVGLFGCVGKGGTVKNVNVTDSYVSGKNSVGGICGYNNGGTLQNCHNTGKVSGNSKVGGVCGRNNEGTLYKSYNEGEVTGTMIVGGVCGENYHNSDSSNNSTVNECYNTGNVTGTSNYVGGVCGNNYGGTVQGCYNTKQLRAHRLSAACAVRTPETALWKDAITKAMLPARLTTVSKSAVCAAISKAAL